MVNELLQHLSFLPVVSARSTSSTEWVIRITLTELFHLRLRVAETTKA